MPSAAEPTTVAELKKWLVQHNVALPPSNKPKADYVALYVQATAAAKAAAPPAARSPLQAKRVNEAAEASAESPESPRALKRKAAQVAEPPILVRIAGAHAPVARAPADGQSRCADAALLHTAPTYRSRRSPCRPSLSRRDARR
jgi:hypothetical protein